MSIVIMEKGLKTNAEPFLRLGRDNGHALKTPNTISIKSPNLAINCFGKSSSRLPLIT